ncbi:MAG: glucose-1-phosphate adenylyltransferase [Deltaproteobacteria bacterium]|nr:glucose-1-phosphate adenylyltransferase [Deltaproteobacteria bacterium]MBW2050093.1 glucose-1-phosphate adenylyltransferase [Deltaproteobacteria bacterium]MBW2112439.1 glucose-1-phosphate adenylyltransferase [Deltaproteobacteria bacterium]MBW2353268.1 glucose-1-phosphate adenylyltransferase [Deltaproteobacteria bacterium]
MKKSLAVVMAGGRGERLMPLTKNRSKPAIPFGGIYLLIDLALSNCVNSGVYNIIVLPQYKSQTLMQHLEGGWNIFSADLGHYLKIAPPQMLAGEKWYQGTADSIRQNLYLIEDEAPEQVLILSGDHVYKMDYARFRRYHEAHGADVTIAVIEQGKELAGQYGVLEVDKEFWVKGFQEKPEIPETIPGDSTRILASMGIYIFKTQVLIDLLRKDDRPDFGKHLLPAMLKAHRVMAYPYRRENRIPDIIAFTDSDGIRREKMVDSIRDSSYWRDVGTVDSYWNANMDLTGVDPYFNMYGRHWPIRTFQRQYPPVKTVFSQQSGPRPRVGLALDSLVAHGSIISGGTVRNSVLSYNVFVQSWASVDESVILENVVIGRHARIKKAIIAEGVVIPPESQIGYHPRHDRKRFTVTSRGITLVTRENFA